jgi:hypothetical protein
MTWHDFIIDPGGRVQPDQLVDWHVLQKQLGKQIGGSVAGSCHDDPGCFNPLPDLLDRLHKGHGLAGSRGAEQDVRVRP